MQPRRGSWHVFALLGQCRDGVKLKLDMDAVDIKCDQNYGQPVKRIVTAVKLSVSMTMLEIDAALALLLDDGKISSTKIGSDLLTGGGSLQLTPVNAADKVAYVFPNAVLEPESDYAMLATGNNTLQLKFTAWPDATGVFMQKATAN